MTWPKGQDMVQRLVDANELEHVMASAEQAEAMRSPRKLNTFLTKHLNEWVNASTAWLDPRKWDACGDESLSIEDFAHDPCFDALDLASKTDLASHVRLFFLAFTAMGYLLIGLMQSASAAFTPTFQAVIPDIVTEESQYTRALSASQVAYTMESMLSPVLAALALTFMSFNWLFVGTSVGFAASADHLGRFDTSDRAYRPGWDPEHALAHINAGRSTHFDATVVDAFLALAADWGITAVSTWSLAKLREHLLDEGGVGGFHVGPDLRHHHAVGRPGAARSADRGRGLRCQPGDRG